MSRLDSELKLVT